MKISTNRLIVESNCFSEKSQENATIEHQQKAVRNQIKAGKITIDSLRSSVSTWDRQQLTKVFSGTDEESSKRNQSYATVCYRR